MKLAWIFALLCTPAIAASLRVNLGQDDIYVYKNGVNTNYQCTVNHFYVETELSGSLYASGCVQTSTDTAVWPVFLPIPMMVRLSGPSVSLEGDCFFVALGRMGSSTSTVIDCR